MVWAAISATAGTTPPGILTAKSTPNPPPNSSSSSTKNSKSSSPGISANKISPLPNPTPPAATKWAPRPSGAQTVNQISDYYADAYFTTGNFVKYHRVPALIRALEPADLIALAREFLTSDLHAFVAVSSVEKALINSLAAELDFTAA